MGSMSISQLRDKYARMRTADISSYLESQKYYTKFHDEAERMDKKELERAVDKLDEKIAAYVMSHEER